MTLRADWTEYSPLITEWLKKYDSISIPLTVILPADRPNEPIVLRDLYLKSTLLEKLKEATTPTNISEAQASRLKAVPK